MLLLFNDNLLEGNVHHSTVFKDDKYFYEKSLNIKNITNKILKYTLTLFTIMNKLQKTNDILTEVNIDIFCIIENNRLMIYY